MARIISIICIVIISIACAIMFGMICHGYGYEKGQRDYERGVVKFRTVTDTIKTFKRISD